MTLTVALLCRRSVANEHASSVIAPSTHTKADALARRIGETMEGLVEVCRPEKLADLRITGLDESVTTEELLQAVAKKGGCRPCKVEIGKILPGPGATGFAKVRCSVDAAKKVAEGDRLKVGWSLARLTVLGLSYALL
ncbi:unnamed protein product [Chilo suppressalis]|uniref:RRM domain-containing protein n=1 Tax=Chilo suppressalis TaxID=168631 RepID=A0ABN8APB0_CHISP|nr:unnamed protein product [Chilo suppressalis]